MVKLEALLRQYAPDADLDDPNLDPAVQQEFSTQERQRLQVAKQRREEAHQKLGQNEARISSMIETIGYLTLTEGGGWDFRGTSSGAVFLKRMKELFGDLLGLGHTATLLPHPSQVPGLMKLDLPSLAAGSSPGGTDLDHVHDLPSKERARHLCMCALNCATALLRIVHMPSFFDQFERIYNKSSANFDPEDHRFLGLLYAVMAVGAMYNITESDTEDQGGYQEAAAEGQVHTLSLILPSQQGGPALTPFQVQILHVRQNATARYHGVPGFNVAPRTIVPDTLPTVDVESQRVLCLPRHRFPGSSPDGVAQASSSSQLHTTGHRA